MVRVPTLPLACEEGRCGGIASTGGVTWGLLELNLSLRSCLGFRRVPPSLLHPVTNAREVVAEASPALRFYWPNEVEEC